MTILVSSGSLAAARTSASVVQNGELSPQCHQFSNIFYGENFHAPFLLLSEGCCTRDAIYV